VVNDATSALLLSTPKVAFASGTESGASIFAGPGLAGLIVIVPSIPDCPSTGVCPEKARMAIMLNAKMMVKRREITE
jgi:hypothetical protein